MTSGEAGRYVRREPGRRCEAATRRDRGDGHQREVGRRARRGSTKSMSRRGWRSRFGFTGTGLAQPKHREPGDRAHRRQDDRAERVDVRDRVQREAAGVAWRCRHRTRTRRRRG